MLITAFTPEGTRNYLPSRFEYHAARYATGASGDNVFKRNWARIDRAGTDHALLRAEKEFWRMMSANNVLKNQVLFGLYVRGEGDKQHFRLEGWSKYCGPRNSSESRDAKSETEWDDGDAARDGGK